MKIWSNLWANFWGNRSRDTGFQAKKLKSQSEIQTVLALKLIAGFAFKILNLKEFEFKREKNLNLKEPGNAISAPTFKLFESDTFIYLLGLARRFASEIFCFFFVQNLRFFCSQRPKSQLENGWSKVGAWNSALI